jgi:hypothetical protein
MNSILISELDPFDVSHDLIINDSKIIINCLIEDNMIDKLLNLFSFCSDSLDTIYINVFQKFINLIVAMDLLDQCSKEFNQRLIAVLNTEEETIEEGHWILLNVSRMLTDTIDNFKI